MKKIKRYFLLIFTTSFVGSVFSQGWQEVVTSGSITPRSNASAIYVSAQQKLFVFGGVTDTGNTNELWSLDLTTNSWTLIPSPSTETPEARITHVCMHDSVGNRMLLWSGQGATLYNDVWAFNFSDSTWQELFADGNVAGAPLQRYGTATIFDPKNRNLINFAGFTTSGRFDDTWSFQVDGKSWTDKTNLLFPLKRCLTSASFAEERREMIVFGGQSSGNLNDSWKLNTETYTWTNITPATSPIARHFSSNVYCGKGHVLIFGGSSLNQGNKAGGLNDLWAFSMDAQRWDSIPQPGAKPLPRYGHTAVYIPELDEMIIFGGQGTSSLFADTWVYTGISDILNSVQEELVSPFSLSCFPNPFQEQTQIRFVLQERSTVTLTIKDISGRTVANLFNGVLPEGEQLIGINDKLSPGIYMCSLRTKSFSETIRLVVVQ